MHNLHKLFRNGTNQNCLLKNLNIDGDDRAALSTARTKIRRHLRLGIEQLMLQQLGIEKVVPKFFTQGSWAYKTLNNPAMFPPQEIDLDDGVYLPMSLINGTSPDVACNSFFKIVDVLLQGLIEANQGWSLVKEKQNCCRVKISSKSHVDLPLYAIPDDEFVRLTEAALTRGYGSITDAAMHFDSYTWLRLPADKVWLAIRDGHWEQSDPRKVNDWFKMQVDIYGEQYVHVCRYLKAWRDYHWESKGPSSILLMVCISNGFKKHRGRDDLSLLGVAERLINQLADDVDSPFTDAEKPLNILDDGERKFASDLAHRLYISLNSAIHGTPDMNVSVDLLAKEFGCRIPNDLSLIEYYTHADVVRSYPKQVVPAPAISKVKAG